jgi:hypothetical protein
MSLVLYVIPCGVYEFERVLLLVLPSRKVVGEMVDEVLVEVPQTRGLVCECRILECW